MLEVILLLMLALGIVCLGLAPLRQRLIVKPIYHAMRKNLPKISQTEREALEAGNTWWDAELFSGKPDWRKLHDLPAATLTDAEQAFLDGPVETLCAMLDEWDITFNRQDLPAAVWDFIKQQKFCGIIIPESYGGLGFSEFAHSQVVMKIASRSTSAAVTVMVPNSLGPAKLLLNYGTEQQKNHYLPRLAQGVELPAFALTGPLAGSDASAMPDSGVVCYAEHAGRKQVLGIRLNWEKRYITLGPVATVLGLAFKLYDPDHLLGEREALGITLALIPTDTPGVSIGRRHYPLESAFQNGPNWGKDVFIPIDWVIGGVEQVGQGWKMLMQCLAAGRAISLPALSVGAAKLVCRNCGAYARVRRQFNVPIGTMEGIAEVLARMAGTAYLMDASRQVTCAALDSGEQPAVISAILKYQLTEGMRRLVNDGMDILGGSGICLGPLNFLGRFYQVIPIGITVEGANILTRTLMIYGQGSVRCHPYVQQEIEALNAAEQQQGIKQFDAVIWRHARFFLGNLLSACFYSLGGIYLTATPGNKHTRRYYRRLARLSNAFAFISDYCLLVLGGLLKRKERLSGTMADVLSQLYLCSCSLRHYQNQGVQKQDQVLLDWACQFSLYQAEQALKQACHLLPLKWLSFWIKLIVFPFGHTLKPPEEKLIMPLASVLLTDNPARDHLTAGIYINADGNDATGRVEAAFRAVLSAEPVETKLREAQKQGLLVKGPIAEALQQALQLGIIDQHEDDLIKQAERASLQAIRVDDFEPEQLLRKK